METRVVLHITSYEAKNFRGWVYNEHFQKKIQFFDLCGMLNAMESLYDTLSFPQATFQSRHFGKVKKSKIIAGEAVNQMEIEEKDRATFVVHVKFRQNATWQGTIQWVDTNKTQSFRSTLEMIKLIDEALDDGGNMKISWEE
jgi:hypothetical protein